MGKGLPFPMANHRGVYMTMFARSGYINKLAGGGKIKDQFSGIPRRSKNSWINSVLVCSRFCYTWKTKKMWLLELVSLYKK